MVNITSSKLACFSLHYANHDPYAKIAGKVKNRENFNASGCIWVLGFGFFSYFGWGVILLGFFSYEKFISCYKMLRQRHEEKSKDDS